MNLPVARARRPEIAADTAHTSSPAGACDGTCAERAVAAVRASASRAESQTDSGSSGNPNLLLAFVARSTPSEPGCCRSQPSGTWTASIRPHGEAEEATYHRRRPVKHRGQAPDEARVRVSDAAEIHRRDYPKGRAQLPMPPCLVWNSARARARGWITEGQTARSSARRAPSCTSNAHMTHRARS